MSKTFQQFSTANATDNPLKSTDYLVGYRSVPDSGDPYEIQVTTANLMSQADRLMPLKNISVDKISYKADGDSTISNSLDNKLNDIRTTADFTSPAAACRSCKTQRLFIKGNSGTINLYIPEDFSTIRDALIGMADWYIENGASINLNVTQNFTFSGPIVLNHPYGKNINIIGAPTGGGRITISPPNISSIEYDLFSCYDGYQFGLIENFYIQGGILTQSYQRTALRLYGGSSIILGTNNIIEQWYYGIYASNGSIVRRKTTPNNASTIVRGCYGVGIYASYGGIIDMPYAVAIGGENCVKADYGGQINCSYGTLSAATYNGAAAFTNAQIKASASTSRSNGGSGFYSKDGGIIECYDIIPTLTVSDLNNRYGYEMLNGGVVYGGPNVGGSSNVLGKINTFVSTFFATDTGATVNANKGSLTVSTSDNSSIYFKTNTTKTQLQIVDNASNSYLTITGGISSGGSAGPVVVSVLGADSDLQIIPKGTSKYIQLGNNVQYGVFTSSPDISANGYITIKDSSGKSTKVLAYQAP